MKAYIFILIGLFYFSYSQYYYYNPKEIFNYFDDYRLTNNEKKDILGNITKIFRNSYAFYDIAKNPPQPYPNYHKTIDIQDKLINLNVNDLNTYNFYSNLSKFISDLKDPSNFITFGSNELRLQDFYFLSPFEYKVKEYQGKQRIFAVCKDENIISEFSLKGKYVSELVEYCKNIKYPIKTINGIDPFKYITNFGENFQASKNNHGTFSRKLAECSFNNLNDYPLTQEQLSTLKVVFDDVHQTTFDTSYMIRLDRMLHEYNPNPKLRGLNTIRENIKDNIKNEKKEDKIKPNLRNLRTDINWNYISNS